MAMGALPSLSMAEACFDAGLAAMIAGTVAVLAWVVVSNQQTMVRMLIEQERANQDLRYQLAAVEIFEKRQIEVLADALDEITPHARRYN